jgi:hypothetical protein
VVPVTRGLEVVLNLKGNRVIANWDGSRVILADGEVERKIILAC